ncbi:MAG: ImmA/IrrE family metallo-endopeptidase [Truepera sp.]|nr:ImmA/IrrE family metallo-endopeptidase [Truepera sp.]
MAVQQKTTPQKAILPINPDILVWARERSGLDIECVARKVGVKPNKIVAWESGGASPTPRQGRLLAKEYKRPFLEFFASSRPEIPETELVPDFRSYTEGPTETERRSLKEIQRWAEEQRLNALSLIEEMGEKPPLLPENLKCRIRDNVNVSARIAREEIGFPIQEQLNLSTSEQRRLPDILRSKIEDIGVLVLRRSELTKLRARGICLFAKPLPTIVFGNEAPSAQAFTMVHEFGHVLLESSAISGYSQSRSSNLTGSEEIESWCNRFAASFLIPSDALEGLVNKPPQPDKDFDAQKLSTLAKSFSISRHVMLIRLVHLGYVEQDFYWEKMRPIFLSEEERSKKGFGRPPYYGRRYVNRQGLFYTGLVLEAWSSGAITGHNAAEYMGIKNLAHLRDIREDFRV